MSHKLCGIAVDFPPQQQLKMMSCLIKVDEAVFKLVEEKLATIISQQFDFLQNGEQIRTTIQMQILQNLYMGILTGDENVLHAFQIMYEERNREGRNKIMARGKQLTEIGLLKWACQVEIKDMLLEFIRNQKQKRQEPFQVVDQMVLVREDKVNPRQIQICVKEEVALQNREEAASPSPTLTLAVSQNHFNELYSNQSAESPFQILNLREPCLPKVNEQLMIYNDKNLLQEMIQLQKKEEIVQLPEEFNNYFHIASQHREDQKDMQKQSEKEKEKAIDQQQKLRQQLKKLNLSLGEGTNSVEQSQIYGHFLYGDQIQDIVNYLFIQKNLYVQIKWKQRLDGVHPQNCFLESAMLKQHCPHELIKIYEQLMN